MKVRVIQWNLKINSNPRKIIPFLQKKLTNRCVVNLQEVSESCFDLLNREISAAAIYSLDLRKPGKYEGRNRKMGVATLVIGGAIDNHFLLNNSLFPDRTIYTKIFFNEIEVHNLTFHSLTGVDYLKAKSSNFASIASFFSEQRIDLFTCDANEPKYDSLDEDLLVFFNNKDKGKNADLLFGKNKIHDLVDSYRYYVKSNKGILEDGFTYIAGGNPKRYDFIYGRKAWNVLSSKALYSESIEATSDHAMVITDYQM